MILRGDARRLPLPGNSVDLIITSPPYFGLRSYVDASSCRVCRDIRSNGLEPSETLADWEKHVRISHHYKGQIGSEATPAEFLAALWECTREWIRVLKPEGNLFVNLGDKYSTGGSGENGTGRSSLNGHGGAGTARDRQALGRSPAVRGFAPKSLLGLPWRYAIGCVDQLGLILRAEIIWSKPNGLPESVTDRVRRSHEQLFHFTRLPRYYSAVDEIREGYSENTHARRKDGLGTSWAQSLTSMGLRRDGAFLGGKPNADHPLGKLPGSVWPVPSAPLVVPAGLGIDHFAAFPPALVRPVVLGWSPPGVCTACGQGRRPVTTAEFDTQGRTTNGPKNDARRTAGALQMAASIRSVRTTTITGYVCACSTRRDHSCDGNGYAAAGACPAAGDGVCGVCGGDYLPPTRPAVVLDPFGGTGTTALVASVHGRTGVSVDLSHDYSRLARWRVRDPGERARALDVPKPPPVPDGQIDLFDMEVS